MYCASCAFSTKLPSPVVFSKTTSITYIWGDFIPDILGRLCKFSCRLYTTKFHGRKLNVSILHIHFLVLKKVGSISKNLIFRCQTPKRSFSALKCHCTNGDACKASPSIENRKHTGSRKRPFIWLLCKFPLYSKGTDALLLLFLQSQTSRLDLDNDEDVNVGVGILLF